MNYDEILFERLEAKKGDVGLVTLNRPKALNALSQTMCIALHQQLDAWCLDERIQAVVVRGTGDRAFCAGGDIRYIYDHGPGQAEKSSSFFWHEYRMNAAIYHFPKPYIALLDGITMGGGCGISMHGSFRVATERLLLAMPETGIGFFPDVGGGYFLSRCPQFSGLYLGLTGERIDYADALSVGFATHAIPSDRLPDLLQALQHAPWEEGAFETVSSILEDFKGAVRASPLAERLPVIERQFSGSSIEEIEEALSSCQQGACREWCEKTRNTLLSRSPTSLAVTFEQIKRAENLSFDEAMRMEFRLACRFLENHDFYEGVRAAIVDKDRSPHWKPKILSEVSQDAIEAFFAPRSVELDLT